MQPAPINSTSPLSETEKLGSWLAEPVKPCYRGMGRVSGYYLLRHGSAHSKWESFRRLALQTVTRINISTGPGKAQRGGWLLYCGRADITANCTTHMTTTTTTRRRDGSLWAPVLSHVFLLLHFLFHNFRYPKDLGCMEKMHTGYDTRRFFRLSTFWLGCGKRVQACVFWFHFCILCFAFFSLSIVFPIPLSLHLVFHTLCYYCTVSISIFLFSSLRWK